MTEQDNTVVGISPTGAKQRFKAVAEHLYSDLNNEAVVLNLANGKYYGMNSVGASVWKIIQDDRSFEEIIARVTEEFDVPADICEVDVRAFLDSMAKEHLIEVADG